jgi:small ubiquitin-related modifier
MNSYCERQGKSIDSVKFMFDGQRVQNAHTPNDLEMEDNDTIEVVVAQIGGF